MHLPKIVEMIALAAQRYGIIVRDQSHANRILCRGPDSVRRQARHASDPYYGVMRDADGKRRSAARQADPNALFDGMWPSTFFEYFPWRSLQVLKMSLHRTS